MVFIYIYKLNKWQEDTQEEPLTTCKLLRKNKIILIEKIKFVNKFGQDM